MFTVNGRCNMRGEKTKVRREKSEYTVQAVCNAIDILELLGNSEHELAISEIVSELSLTKSNVNKLLANLERFGYVEHNRYTGNFRLGVKTFQISQTYMNKISLIEVSHYAMQALRDKLNESVYIGVLHGNNVVYLDVIETDEAVRVLPRTGNVGPAYALSIGKAQLSLLDDSDILSRFDSFNKYTSKTVDSPEALLEDIKKVRERGYALDLEEYEEGVNCIGAPILNFMGEAIAGISVSAPFSRMDMNRIENEIVPALLETARELSRKFGYFAD